MRTGLHCNTTRDPAKILDYYRRSGAKVVKVLEFDDGLLGQLKALGVTIIGRNYRSPQNLGDGDFVGDLVTLARQHPTVDYWEGFNEEFQGGNELARYADYEIGRMKRLETVGKKAIIGCFSCGQPDEDEWPRFRPALEYALAHGHALGLHEYSGPYMQWMTGANQWDREANQPRRIDDPCTDPTVDGWLTLRYRKVWRKWMVPWGLGDLPLFITEGGVDDVQPRPGGQGKGYKDFASTEWARIPGIGDYATQRHWYMWQVSHDRYVRGVVDFGFETADPTWSGFDLSTDPAMLAQIISLETSLPAGHFGDTDGGSGGTMTTVEGAALDVAASKQAIQLNPGAGLQKAIAAAGFWPTSGEFDFAVAGSGSYIGQRAEHPATGEVRVYYCPKPAYTPIKFVVRPK